MVEISISDISALLTYDPETGKLYWKHRPSSMFRAEHFSRIWNTRFSGAEALTAINNHGYPHGRILGAYFQAHRIAWLLHYGTWPAGQIDHINGDRSDNRLLNLRDISGAENQRNMKTPKNSKSGICGVLWYKPGQKWRAQIRVNNSTKHLGYFDTIEEAIAARRRANMAHGFHPNHGRQARAFGSKGKVAA